MTTSLFFRKALFVIIPLLSFNECINAQWAKTAGPQGMNVNVFYQRGNTLFAGTSPKGVFKSVDNGVSWTASNIRIAEKSVFSLIANNNFLFAGTDSGVFRSPDNGVTWQAVNSGIEGKFVYSFKFAKGFLFAGTSFGLYKSPDEGVTWSDASGGGISSSIIHDITFSSPHLVVIADNLIFYSDNNGDSWNATNNSPFVFGVNSSFLTRHDSILVATGSVVSRSFNGGVTWGSAITAAPDLNIDGLVGTNDGIAAGTEKGIFFSSDFGKKWKPVHAHSIRSGSWLIHKFYKSGNNYLLGYDEIGLGYSADSGKNWNYTVQGFPPAASIDNSIIFSNNTVFTGTHGDGVYKSINAGNTWTKTGTVNNTDTLSNSNIYAMLKINKIVLAGTCGHGLYRSDDNGITWAHVTNGLPQQQGTDFLCVKSFAKTKNAILIATDQGLFYSNDAGLTWKTTNLAGNDVVAVAANDSVACAAIQNFTGPSAIYRSVKNPASWNIVFQSDDADWTSMASDGKSHFYAGTLSAENLVSKNDGVSWDNLGPGLPPGSGAFAIGVLNNNVFIGNSSGVYFSNNNGTSFSKENAGFNKNHAVQGFTFSSTDVYAGLFQNSIWKRPLSDFGITTLQNHETGVSSLPVTFTPNPLITESRLTYSIASTEHVIVNLYNANGNLIKNIKDAVQDAGSYSLTINKANLHTGNYFISVVAGSKHAVVDFIVEGN